MHVFNKGLEACENLELTDFIGANDVSKGYMALRNRDVVITPSVAKCVCGFAFYLYWD